MAKIEYRPHPRYNDISFKSLNECKRYIRRFNRDKKVEHKFWYIGKYSEESYELIDLKDNLCFSCINPKRYTNISN